MSDMTVMQTIYAREFVQIFEQKQSILRGTVTTEGDVRGNQYVFIIEGAAAIAVTRGASGNIPYAADNQTSTTCTLYEYHHLARKNQFNIESSSVPQRLSMQRRGVVSINQRTDQLILAQLNTTTYNTGTTGGEGTGANSLGRMLTACELLDVNYVPDDGERYGLLTPKAWAFAMKIDQFVNKLYVAEDTKPYMNQAMWYDWNGVKWTRHPNLPGTGTASASCFVYHKNAIGHALNLGEMQTYIGYRQEQDYSWARVSAYMGAQILQPAGTMTRKCCKRRNLPWLIIPLNCIRLLSAATVLTSGNTGVLTTMPQLCKRRAISLMHRFAV